LRTGLDHAACVDLLLTYSGPSIYRQLVVEYGWSTLAYTTWLREILTDLLATPQPNQATLPVTSEAQVSGLKNFLLA
jgi:hypothetical protein